MPRFSVFVPVWNDASWLPGAIESVLTQTYADWELVIGDNASTEDLAAIAGRYAEPRIRYHRWPTHTEIFENFNRTAGLCRYEWVQLLCADDRLHPRCLERLAARMSAATPQTRRLAMVITACRRVDAKGASADKAFYRAWPVVTIPEGLYDAEAWVRFLVAPGVQPWNFGSVAVAHELLDEMGGFFRPEVDACTDIELTLRAAAYGDIAYIDEPLLDYTVRSDSDRVWRFDRSRARGDARTTLGAALLAAWPLHEARRPVSDAERTALFWRVADTHLHRALEHRYANGGRGRQGALLDVARAIAASPTCVLSPPNLARALTALLAPRAAVEWLKAVVPAQSARRGLRVGASRPAWDRRKPSAPAAVPRPSRYE